MRKQQLIALFGAFMTIGTVGAVTGGLLPVYAQQLGADSSMVGFYLSSTFAAIAVGLMATGWLSEKFKRRKVLLMVVGTIVAVTLVVMSRVENITQLFAVSFVMFVAFGIQIAISNIIVGLTADQAVRGRVFGIMATTNPLGSILGGAVGGAIVERWGFSSLLIASAGFALIVPVVSLFLDDGSQKSGVDVSTKESLKPTTKPRSALLSPTYLLLFFSMIIVFLSLGSQGLSRMLIMGQNGFDAAAIATTLAVGGIIGAPFPLILGWLSDRIGRKAVLIVCFGILLIGFTIFIWQPALWLYCVSAGIQWIVVASSGIGSALVTDIVEPEALSTGLSLLGATNFIGLVIGTGLTGAAIQYLGVAPTLVIGALLALVTIGLTSQIKRSHTVELHTQQVMSTN
jgi:MFS family permease